MDQHVHGPATRPLRMGLPGVQHHQRSRRAVVQPLRLPRPGGRARAGRTAAPVCAGPTLRRRTQGAGALPHRGTAHGRLQHHSLARLDQGCTGLSRLCAGFVQAVRRGQCFGVFVAQRPGHHGDPAVGAVSRGGGFCWRSGAVHSHPGRPLRPPPQRTTLRHRAQLGGSHRVCVYVAGHAAAGVMFPKQNYQKGRTHKFTLDALVNVAAKLGCTVKLSLKRVA